MTAELRDELASNACRLLVDPRTVPVRFHHMKAMGQSAAHCLAAFQEPDWKQSLALRIGSGVHAMLFRDRPVVRWDGKVRNGKVWDAFKADHSGSVILSKSEHAKSESIAEAINRHDQARSLLFANGALLESTIEWEQLGRSRRSTPDVRAPGYLVELKTTRCAQPDRFTRDGTFRGYHAQLADQRLAAQYATGRKPDAAYIVAVETVRPYAVTVLELTPRALDRGEALCRGWLERILVCESEGHWPAYCESIQSFDVPDDDIELAFADADEAESEMPF